MADSVKRELIFDVFKLFLVKRTIRKRRLNSGQMEVTSMEFFSLYRRQFCRGIREVPDMRQLYSQTSDRFIRLYFFTHKLEIKIERTKN